MKDDQIQHEQHKEDGQEGTDIAEHFLDVFFNQPDRKVQHR